MVYWALGGGHGHAVRGLAVLGRLAERAPGRLKTRLVAPARHTGWCGSRGVELLAPPAQATSRERLAAWAESLPSPRRLVVDVFPRGVLGELSQVLPALPRRAWLVCRRVRPDVLLAPELRAALEAGYERIEWCEEPDAELAELRVPARRVGPVLACRVEDCLDAEAARRELELPADGPVVLMLGSGTPQEQGDRLRLLLKARERIAAGGGPRFLLVVLSARLPPGTDEGLLVCDAFPAMRLLRAATLVVASGGYASFHETRALGVPALFLPQSRPFDDQAARVRASDPPSSPEELEARLRELLGGGGSAAGGKTQDLTPAGDGADAIAQALLEAD